MTTDVDLSLAEFQHLCRQQIEYLDAISNLQSFQMVKIKTQIKNLEYAKKKNYKNKIYNIILTDGKVEIRAQSDFHIIENIKDNDFVEVICFCQPTKDYKNESLEMSANIISVRTLSKEEVPSDINHATTILKSLNLKPNRFPRDNNRITLSLIYSSSSAAQVHQDFLGALGDFKHEIEIEELKTRFNNIDELLATIEMAKGNVIAIIRGGGDSNDLMIFDEDKVLQKIADLKSYRIAGIGHSADNNLVNAVVDYSATTPTDAGNHLKEQLMQNKRDMWEISNLRQNFKNLEANVLELETKNNELQNRIVATRMPTKSTNINNILIVVIVVLILIVIVK
ncbi:exodeoxyribonuclease VII large subunit [Acinetobacter sp. ANC 5378]|uniref:exodeoxyribonuclease VII large subunit n=1 Tax=Acinetobacter sp. ANC 5378 TaxID=2731249 RepID=UPI00148F9463|nr:exodeoxyribonuclease VII large subunit [Acinetobacter sp. ANC 5378]NNG80631.1 hypothetical protein [Acinetobacter sp. ANC 5378]